MIVQTGGTDPAEYWAWPPGSGFSQSGSGPNPPRNPGTCILNSVRVSKGHSDFEEKLFVDLLCDGKDRGVMVPLCRKPEFQRYIESVLRQHVGESVDQISEVEIEWPLPQK